MRFKTSEIINKLIKSKLFYIGILILLLGIFINQYASYYLTTRYNDLPVLHDFILDRIPTFRVSFVFDIIAILIPIVFVGYIFRNKLEYVPYYLVLFGIFYAMRGVFVVLTPFNNPTPIDMFNGFLRGELFNKGVYPSGHAGSGFLTFFLVEGMYKRIILLLVILLIIFLLLGRGHYSIDIFSAIIVGLSFLVSRYP